MIEYKVGTIVNIMGEDCEVVAQEGCEKCAFKDIDADGFHSCNLRNISTDIVCSSRFRQDGLSVQFVPIALDEQIAQKQQELERLLHLQKTLKLKQKPMFTEVPPNNIELLLELRKQPGSSAEQGYIINCVNDTLIIEWYEYCTITLSPIFFTKDQANNAIEAVGRDKLIHLFNILGGKK